MSVTVTKINRGVVWGPPSDGLSVTKVNRGVVWGPPSDSVLFSKLNQHTWITPPDDAVSFSKLNQHAWLLPPDDAVSFSKLNQHTWFLIPSPVGPSTATHGKRAKLTVQSSQVTGVSLSNYVVYVTEANLPAGIFHATTGAKPDGGDIRAASNSAATTEYAIDVVYFDKATQKALICVLLPTVSSSTNTDFYLFWNSTNPDVVMYQPTHTYGRNAVWTDYTAAFFFDGTTVTDRTSANRTVTVNGGVTSLASGPFSRASRFNGTTGQIQASSVAHDVDLTITMQVARHGNGDTFGRLFHLGGGNVATGGGSVFNTAGTDGTIEANTYNGSGTGSAAFGSFTMVTDTWYELAYVSSTTGPADELFVDDISRGTGSSLRATSAGTTIGVGGNAGSSTSSNAQIDVAMLLVEPRIDADRKTTGKNNRNAPGTFIPPATEEDNTASTFVPRITIC